jgi:hypothetical protein
MLISSHVTTLLAASYCDSTDSIVVVAARLWAGQSGVWIPAEARDFSLHENVLTSSVARPTYCWMRTWILLCVKHLGYTVDHSPPSSTSACHEWRGQVQFYRYLLKVVQPTCCSNFFHEFEVHVVGHVCRSWLLGVYSHVSLDGDTFWEMRR